MFAGSTAVSLICLLILFLLPAAAQEGRRSATIGSVIDGNTLLTTEREQLRLIDVGLPQEQSHRDSLVEYLRGRVAGKKVLLERDYLERDGDGAALVYVFVDDQLLNAEILARGLAKMKHSSVNVRYQVLFFKSQASAYRAGYGIWGGRPVEKEGESAGSAAKGVTSASRPVRYERVKKQVLIKAERMNNDGVDKAEKGDMQGAINLWQDAAQLMPELLEGRYNLVRGKIELGSHDEAEALIKKLMEERPKEALPHTLLGMALLGRGKPDEALEHHKQALSLKPDLYEARLNIARTYETVGDLQRALYEYNGAKAMASDDPYVHFAIGGLYQSMGESDKAQQSLNKSLELSSSESFGSAVRSKLEAVESEKGVSTDVLSERLSSGVVQVQVTRMARNPLVPLSPAVRQTSIGAGFILNSKGEVITSAKLISDAGGITVRLYEAGAGGLSQTSYPAEVVIYKQLPSVKDVPFLDFALIRMTTLPKGLKALELSSASNLKPDAEVYSMGYPGGKGRKLLKGVVTDVREVPGDEKQRAALLKSYPAMGTSPVKKVKIVVSDLTVDEQLQGAPLVDKSGRVIGLNVLDFPGYEGKSVSLDIGSVRGALQR